MFDEVFIRFKWFSWADLTNFESKVNDVVYHRRLEIQHFNKNCFGSDQQQSIEPANPKILRLQVFRHRILRSAIIAGTGLFCASIPSSLKSASMTLFAICRIYWRVKTRIGRIVHLSTQADPGDQQPRSAEFVLQPFIDVLMLPIITGRENKLLDFLAGRECRSDFAKLSRRLRS